MDHMIKKILPLLLIMLAACQEKEGDDVATGIQEQHLSLHNWQLEKIRLQLTPGGESSDITANVVDPCESDDEIRFNQNGAYQFFEGPKTCSGSGRTVFRNLAGGQWTYRSQDSVLEVIQGLNKQHFKMITLNPERMEMHQASTDYFGNRSVYQFFFLSK
jgi:hypothetical protein